MFWSDQYLALSEQVTSRAQDSLIFNQASLARYNIHHAKLRHYLQAHYPNMVRKSYSLNYLLFRPAMLRRISRCLLVEWLWYHYCDLKGASKPSFVWSFSIITFWEAPVFCENLFFEEVCINEDYRGALPSTILSCVTDVGAALCCVLLITLTLL